MKVDHVSFSMLDAWGNCPYRASKLYTTQISIDTDALALGTMIHTLLYEYYEPSNMKTLREMFEELWEKYGIWNLHIYDDAVSMIMNYEKNHKETGEIIAREKRFEIDTGAGIPIVGVIDRIDYIESNPCYNYEIIDYKTGAFKKNQADVDRDLQLSIYDWAFHKMYEQGMFPDYPEIVDTKLSLLYLRYDKVSTFRTEEDREFIDRMILATTKQILEEDNPQPRLNQFCPYCFVKYECPAYLEYAQTFPNINRIQEMTDEELLKEAKEAQMKQKIIEDYRNALLDEIRNRLEMRDMSTMHTPLYVAKTYSRAYKDYDMAKVKKILKPIGVYDEVVKLDNSLLKKAMEKYNLPPNLLDGTYTISYAKATITITESEGKEGIGNAS